MSGLWREEPPEEPERQCFDARNHLLVDAIRTAWYVEFDKYVVAVRS